MAAAASLWGWASAQDGRLKKKIAAAKKKGLKGYKLIDAVDVWFGTNEPEFKAPRAVIDMLGDSDGKATVDDWLEAGLPKEHFKYFDKDGDGQFDHNEAWAWWMQRAGAEDMDLSEVENPPRGHFQRLGSHKDPLPADDLVYHKPYPHPRDFWKKHMDGYLPAILKGAQHGWPVMNWTKEVLKEKFGWVDAKLEPKVEGRGNSSAYKDLDKISPKHRMSIEDYLDIEEGKNIYVVSIIPQAMAWEVAHPSVLLCGSRSIIVDRDSKPPYKVGKHDYPHETEKNWMTHIFEANLWMGSGKTRSQLHYDKEWNVNCLISGRKRWVFINPFDADGKVQWARGEKFRKDNPLNNAWTDWVYLDPDAVDLIVQNKLRDLDYMELYQEAGDCIFLPYAILHQVEKLDTDLQVAVSWMFLPETMYDEGVCQDAPLDEDLPLAAMDTLYLYNGKGIIPQGYGDPKFFRDSVKREMKSAKEKHLSIKTLKNAVTRGDSSLKTVKDKKARIQKIYDVITEWADDPEKGLRRDELDKVPLRVWCKPAAEGDTDGPLPCDQGEEYLFCDNEEFTRMENYVQGALERKKAKEGDVKKEKPPPPGKKAPPRVWKPGQVLKSRQPQPKEEL